MNPLIQPEKTVQEVLLRYKKEVTDELFSVLAYWEDHTVDKEYGGFYGSINNDNVPDISVPKGIVLNSRILWAFSAAGIYTGEERFRVLATRAFNYILRFFIDGEYGGVFWSVDYNGKVHDDRKQIYGWLSAFMDYQYIIS
jgi:mannobiose 2-epimerase